MAVKNFSFKVDLITKNSLCRAHVKQNDNAIFNIYLTKQGQALDLTNQQVRLFVRKPDGKLVVQEEAIHVVDAKGGAIKVDVQNSIFQAVGVAVCEIDMWGNDGKNASSGSFLINIDEQLGSNDVVKSYVDVNLFRQLSEYIDEANAEILKYKTLFESFVKAGVSLQGINDIKAYIDNNLAELKFEADEAVDLIPKVNKARTDAESKRVEVINVTATAEAKMVEVVNTINSAEAKRKEVVDATATADASKNNLITTTTNADNKKKEVEVATASSEAKRKEIVTVTETANTSKGQLEAATANAEAKRSQVVAVTTSAEAKMKELQGVIDAVGSAEVVTKAQLDTKLDKTAHLRALIPEEAVDNPDTFDSNKMWTARTTGSMTNRPTDYATVVNFGVSANSNGQMAWNYSRDVLKLYFRQRHDISGNYGAWEQIYHTGYKPTIKDLGAMGLKKLPTDGGEYYGMTAPDGDDVSWLRTTKRGIIPYQSGGNSTSSLGSESWRFHEAWADYFRGRRLDLNEFDKTFTLGISGGDCFLVNSIANRCLQFKDDGRLCYNNVNLVLDNQSETLWEGVYYMLGSQSVFPSKPLSECRSGWVLVWSDYDSSPGKVNDYNFVYTYIPKNTAKYFNDNTNFVIPVNETDNPIIKTIYFNNTGFSGHDVNTANGSDDVVLRAVLEY